MALQAYLKIKKPIVIKRRVKSGLFGSTRVRTLVIPPLNTDITFSSVLPQRPAIPYGMSSINTTDGVHVSARENFSWHLTDDEDMDVMLFKKKLIEPVFNQQSCGSCWAVATATTMSDCLVASGAVEWAPRISPTYCMACYKHEQCRGGHPATLALQLEVDGASDSSCLDYSWCENNKSCNITDASTHFEATDQSHQIPPCGCYYNTQKYLYKLDEGTNTLHVFNDMEVEAHRHDVRSHIVDYGPVVGGFVILNNFLSGAFTDVEEGVYFDRADYSNIQLDGTIPFSDAIRSDINASGLHAVSIMGWGVAKDIQYDTDKIGDVPFWWCRNSWSTRWGDNGYFKMAMYPYNKISQFDQIVNIRVKGMISTVGGLMLMKATQPPDIQEFKDIPKLALDKIKLIYDEAYYSNDGRPNENETTDDEPTSTNIDTKLIFVIVIIIGVIIMYSVYKLSGNSKENYVVIPRLY